MEPARPTGVAGDSLIHQPYRAGVADVVATEFNSAVAQHRRAHEVEQRLRPLHEIVALSQHEVEAFPGEGQEVDDDRLLIEQGEDRSEAAIADCMIVYLSERSRMGLKNDRCTARRRSARRR